MAEGEGFEPPELLTLNGFQDRRNKPDSATPPYLTRNLLKYAINIIGTIHGIATLNENFNVPSVPPNNSIAGGRLIKYIVPKIEVTASK